MAYIICKYGSGGGGNIPDGKTVTPTDDIQIWLHCANIWDKTYTTLAEVLADTDTLLALISSNNAVDYMVRSTSWAISNVPTMTSNTTPSGECISSGAYNTTFDNWKAFDGDTATYHLPILNEAISHYYLGYVFDKAVNVTSMEMYADSYSASYYYNLAVYGGNSLSDLTKLSENVQVKTAHTTAGTRYNVSFANTHEYTTYVIKAESSNASAMHVSGTAALYLHSLQFFANPITADATAMTYIGQNNYCANTLLADATWCNAICNSEYFESVLNVKVPTMTSATTPEGAVIESGHYTSNYGWQAFDGNTSTRWAAATQNVGEYCGYVFTTPNAVAKIQYITASNVNYTAQLKGSNDGVTWTNVSDTFALGNSDNASRVVYNGIQYDRYAVFAATSGIQSFIELQFYGRKDV